MLMRHDVDRRIEPWDLKQSLSMRQIELALMDLADASMRVMADCDSGWYALHVDIGRECAVSELLRRGEIHNYVPRWNDITTSRRRWKNEPKTVPGSAMIEGYVFVRCAPLLSAFRGMKALKHVDDVLGTCASPWRFSDRKMSAWMDLAEAWPEEEPDADGLISIGSAVVVKLGPWADWRGKVAQVDGKWRHARVEIGFGGRTCTVKMPLAYLEKL